MKVTVSVSEEYIKAYATQNKYKEKVKDPNNGLLTIDNPQSKEDFFNFSLKRYLDVQYVAQEGHSKGEEARLLAIHNANAYVKDNVLVDVIENTEPE